MITLAQIRAARALLDWSQSDLAEYAGLSQTGIARIENGTNKPNSRTLDKIQTAFDQADIEFINSDGVRKRSGQVRVLRGQDGLRRFFDEIYQTLKAEGGEVCIFNGMPDRLPMLLGQEWYDMHVARMRDVTNTCQYRIIVKKGEANLPARDYAEYRYFPEDLFHAKTIYIIGDKVFFRDYQDEVRLIRIEQEAIAKSIKVLFDIAWTQVAEK